MAIIAMFSDMNKIIFLLKLQKNIFGFQVQQSHQRPEQFFETCSKSQRYGRNLLEFITNPLKKKKGNKQKVVQRSAPNVPSKQNYFII